MSLRASAFPAFLAAVGVLLVLVASVALGPLALLAPIAAGAVLVLLARPGLALGVAVGLPMLVESEPDWGPSSLPSRIYEQLPGTKVAPVELLVLVAVAAVLLERRVHRRPLPLPTPFAAPLLVLGLAYLSGAVTGHDAGAGLFTLFNAARDGLPMLILPFVVVAVVGDLVSLRTALTVVLAMAAVKGIAGVGALLVHETASSPDAQQLTYYSGPANALTMLALLFGCGAALRRLPLPLWAWAAMPFIAACLLLSYRRGFWIATVLGLALMAIAILGGSQRRLGVPAVALVVIAGVLGFSSIGGGGLAAAQPQDDSSISGRVASINPTSISSNKQDRYRIGERRNVVAALRAAPVTGLGLGVDYVARYPLSITDIPHDYVHFAALWWWMKTGILGLVGYVWVMLAAVLCGARIWRRHPDALVRMAGLAASAGCVGLAVNDLTATYVGPDIRSSIWFGALLGLLAVGAREAGGAPRALDEDAVGAGGP